MRWGDGKEAAVANGQHGRLAQLVKHLALGRAHLGPVLRLPPLERLLEFGALGRAGAFGARVPQVAALVVLQPLLVHMPAGSL